MNLNLGDSQLIIQEAKSRGVLRNQLAYILATAYHETNHTIKPVVEAYWLSEEWRKKNLRYYPWHGRGYVQLTWEPNYIKAEEQLGIELTDDPSVVMQPDVAAKILVEGMIEGWFTGKKLSDYITLSKSDFRNARKIINGLDKATTIENYAKAYDQDLLKIGYGVEPKEEETQCHAG